LNASDANRLANDVIAARATTPFTHLISTRSFQAGDLSCFRYFISQNALNYLNATEENNIAESVDASLYNSGLTGSWTGANTTVTEFCYYTNRFLIRGMGEDGGVSREASTVFGYTYDYGDYSLSSTGTFYLPRYIGQVNSPGYWKELRR
jgi:hypothetical protein